MMKIHLTLFIFNLFLALMKQVKSQYSADDYQFKYDRLELVYNDPRICRGNISVQKYNRTTVKTDIYFQTFKMLNNVDADMEIKVFRFDSNKYSMKNTIPYLDFCVVVSTGQMGMRHVMKNTNAPRLCPLSPGKYYLKDIVFPNDLSQYKLPPIAILSIAGKWKLQITLKSNKNPYAVFNFFYAVEKIPKW